VLPSRVRIEPFDILPDCQIQVFPHNGIIKGCFDLAALGIGPGVALKPFEAFVLSAAPTF